MNYISHASLSEYGVVPPAVGQDTAVLWTATFKVPGSIDVTLRFTDEPEDRSLEALMYKLTADAVTVMPPEREEEPEAPAKRHLLFFYGTLMSGHGRGNVLTGRETNVGTIDLARPVARGTIRGLMHDVSGAFPALVDGDGVVHGEVWEAPSEAHLRAALGITDAIEGYRGPDASGNLYDRIEVPLLSADADGLEGATVLTYRYAGRSWLGAPIPSGDWREFRRGDSVWSAA